MKKIQPDSADMSSVTRPSMMPGDNNRKPFASPQMVNKVFQQYKGAQQNPPSYADGYNYDFSMAPFTKGY